MIWVPVQERRARPRNLANVSVDCLRNRSRRSLPLMVLASPVLDHLNRSASKRRYPALDQSQVAEAANLYRSGKYFGDIGIAFGVHTSTVRHHLCELELSQEA